MDLHSLLLKSAIENGFPLAGAIDLAKTQEFLKEHVNRYDHWLSQGMAGAMEYLVRGRDRRANPSLVFPEAKSILCVAIPYPRKSAGEENPKQGPRYARYLSGKDYHEEIHARLEQVMKSAQDALGEPLKWKVCVDTSAVLERSWAALAGLGWIGKNSMLIHPRLGSYLFLGEVLIDRETGQGPRPIPNYCGHCTRCLESCPTKAFSAPGVLDARRCISYWTLEKRGPLELSASDRKALGTWIAGCDLCQEVCPFNVKPSRTDNSLSDTGAIELKTWMELLNETESDYSKRIRDSALSRVKSAQFSRNLAMTLTHALDFFSSEETKTVLPLVIQRIEKERDPAALDEWEKCYEKISNLR